MTGIKPFKQPKFDSRIATLKYPLGGTSSGYLKRGSMIWAGGDVMPPGYSEVATMHFLYNPSTVTATYSLLPDTSVAAGMLFPTAANNTQLRVPLSQSVEWALLFDRTYELWHQYDSSGTPIQPLGPEKNNPSVIGVMADIMQMQQFTGMTIGYWTDSTGNQGTQNPGIYKQQGIMQPVYSYVFFGDNANLWYYGYVSEWDVTITHWTQFMVPMRCVINVTFNLMPLQNVNAPAQTANADWTLPSITNVPGTNIGPTVK